MTFYIFSDMDGWRFLPYSSRSLDKRKLTRRRAELLLKMGDFFPAEGHCSTILSCENSEEGRIIRLAVTGGARRQEEGTWDSGSNVHVVTFNVDDEDVTTSNIVKATVTGAHIPPLTSAAMVKNTDGHLLIFGGMNTAFLEPSNEMIHLVPVDNNKFVSKIFKDQNTSQLVLRSDLLQSGDIPLPRFGHTLTRIGKTNKAILFGGLTMDQRHTQTIGRRFSQVATDNAVYVLDMHSMKWTRGQHATSRTFHQAVYIEARSCIMIIGGVLYAGREPKERLNLQSCLKINLHDDSITSIEECPLIGPPIYFSFGSAGVAAGCIILQGGYQEERKDMNKHPHISGDMILVDIQALEYKILNTDVHFKTATVGHTSLSLDDTCVMFMGGSCETIFCYSSKTFTPGACDLADSCNISDSPEVSPIAWIQCEGHCKRWIHQFCADITIVPKGAWKCKQCQQTKKRNQSRKKR